MNYTPEEVFEFIKIEISWMNDAEKRELADELGVHWGTIYSWLKRDMHLPRTYNFHRVAEYFGYTMSFTYPQEATLRLVK